jgi:hypothetical protein
LLVGKLHTRTGTNTMRSMGYVQERHATSWHTMDGQTCGGTLKGTESLRRHATLSYYLMTEEGTTRGTDHVHMGSEVAPTLLLDP